MEFYSDNLPLGAQNDPRAPWNEEDEKNDTCRYCGAECVDQYCDESCYRADMADYNDQDNET